MKNNRPHLQRYMGRESRFPCPKCGDKHSFVYYVDSQEQVIDKRVGRCNHESSCGYHYTPKQFFIDYPIKRDRLSVPVSQNGMRSPRLAPGSIPFSYVQRSASYKSDFVSFLCTLFDHTTLESPTIERLMNDYALGATKDERVIFWQIDIQGRVRTGKIMRYDPKRGKRVKESGGINWVHALMKRREELPSDFNLVQCLFGEHLLKIYPEKVVALVESEKSAVIAAGVYPDYLWLATGGKSQLSIEKLKVLRGRTLILFPDVDGFELWSEKANELKGIGCQVMVSDLLEKNATPEDRAAKIDLADWLIRQLQETEADRIVRAMMDQNPALGSLIEKFRLKVAKG